MVEMWPTGGSYWQVLMGQELIFAKSSVDIILMQSNASCYCYFLVRLLLEWEGYFIGKSNVQRKIRERQSEISVCTD